MKSRKPNSTMNVPQMSPAATSTEIKGGIEIRKVGGEIDEIVCPQCNFHLEQMSDGHWWIGIDTPGGQSLEIVLSTRRGAKIRAFAEFE